MRIEESGWLYWLQRADRLCANLNGRLGMKTAA
jgi:hypothetical protein